MAEDVRVGGVAVCLAGVRRHIAMQHLDPEDAKHKRRELLGLGANGQRNTG